MICMLHRCEPILTMYADIFEKPEGQNWLKQWRAVFITRKALLTTVSTEAKNFHGYLLQEAHKNSKLKCTNICTSKSCLFHTFFRGELLNMHARGSLAMKNTKTENWFHSPWEIAKVFMPPSGYLDKTTIDETDFNGIAGFIINCKRFQGRITDSICEKAREAVNNIRHMPDMCASVLTDQATTECIDNLCLLLNEPGLKNLPEVVQALKELDKLKTEDLSKDEKICKYICHEFKDESHQRLGDIEMKLESMEIDTQTAIDSKHTEGDRIQKNLGLLCEVFSFDLSKLKNEILLSINEEKERAIDHITEHIKQSVTDGKTTIEQSVEKGQRALEDKKEILVQQLRKEVDENLQQRKRDLQKQLLNHYQTTAAVRINVRLDIDAAVEDIYEKPKLNWKTKKEKDGQITDEDISKIDQIFLSDNDMMAKTIFVEGEPGTGKSSLCKRLSMTGVN
ncbi:uncharacterized protein LOC128228896 [Mya arenaria]|uniref:uncharacterized protein LOC128228896 n=1 Tax=Mya arenaria TaxID=6604 RepID=UPI0022E6F19A|nr:uncharacterized protein LOC128228896 [Mya arenaria]